MLTEEAKQKKAEYMKEWRKNNPEKQKEYQTTYWNKKAKADEDK